MEIERKYLIAKENIPFDPAAFPCHYIEQGYLCTEPVIRIRRDNDDYILTYKAKGMMVRQEHNLPLNKSAYEHLKTKVDGRFIEKKRYVIPFQDGLHIELDFFSGFYDGLILAEIEFLDVDAANRFVPPDWFGEDVTYQPKYHNSFMSKL